MDSPLKHSADLRDPRAERTREYLLAEILLITPLSEFLEPAQ